MVTALEEGVILADHQGLVQACNTSAERILGVAPGRLLKRSLHDPNWQAIHEDGHRFPNEQRPLSGDITDRKACAAVILGLRVAKAACDGSRSIPVR